jgi:hypothetical protein
MRGTTVWSIGCAVAWLFFDIIAAAKAPSGVDDPNFDSKVATAGGLQGIGSICLIAAIILILITAYKNLFSKESVKVAGDWNQASYGSTIVSRTQGNVIASAEYRPNNTRSSILNSDQAGSLEVLKSFLQQEKRPDAERASSLIRETESSSYYC